MSAKVTGKPLRVLIVEDEEKDAELLRRALRRGGFDVTSRRVDTRESMGDALAAEAWDVVVSDFHMPRFGPHEALALLKERGLDLPFILVSGTVGEDTAVEALKAGAHDFMVKGNFARLIPAIERELREAAIRAERAKMQEQLLISERMASMGTLAAGVAHEINNPLAGLMVNLQYAIQEAAKLHLQEIEEPLRDAQEAAERVKGIVRDLKIFSRADEERSGPVDVRRIMESSLRMAWNEIRHRARLVKDYGEVPPILGNEGRLGQVFLNLIVNAAQAMPEGCADANEIRVTTRMDERGRVVVEVRDTGAGMPESVLARVFDPFFTTKPIGVGTGLGLAICHRIVTGLGGAIDVRSREGEGTTFRVVLPVATAAALTGAAPEAVTAPAGARGRVLVIDDEPMIGTSIKRMMAAEHDVHLAARARDAADRIAGGERFDIILCDLMMPDMTGMDLHRELLRDAPDQAERMVFMTGGAFTARARAFLDQVQNARLEKPFDVATLRALLRARLGG